MKPRYVYSLLADILRAGEGLILDLFNSDLVIYRSFTSMKPRYVYSLLADILRPSESLILDLYNSVLVIYLSFISMTNWQAF